MSDARVADAALIGDRNNGWAVANTTLAFERAGLGSFGRDFSAADASVPDDERETIPGELPVED